MCSLTKYWALTGLNTSTQQYSFIWTTVCANTSGLLYYYCCYESSPLEGYFTADCEACTHLIYTYLRTGNRKVIDMIYLLTAIGLTPGGSSTVHIYTLTIHRRTQLIWEQCGPCPVFASCTLVFDLQLRKYQSG
jgi:hypothetical protein